MRGAGEVEEMQVAAAPWGEYGWLRQGFSARGGGVSTVYGPGSGSRLRAGTLNLGWTKEDEPGLVAENRRRLISAVGDGMRLVTARQVHGVEVQVIRAGDKAIERDDGRAVLEGDGLVTEVPGVLLGVGTADCVPVLVADVRRRAVGAFHAGWRGTVGRIVERGVAAMREAYGTEDGDLIAAVGPAIGPCCYEVGAEVRERFGEEFGYGGDLFVTGEGGRTRLDLWEANRRQLLGMGVAEGRIWMAGTCTACSRTGAGERRFFSHRAEAGVTGRMLSVIGIAAGG